MNALVLAVLLSVLPEPELSGPLFHEHCYWLADNVVLCELAPVTDGCED